MKKINEYWKQRKNLEVNFRNNAAASQNKSYLKERVDYGNISVTNDDDDFLKAVKHLEKNVGNSSKLPKLRPITSAQRGKATLNDGKNNVEMERSSFSTTDNTILATKILELASLNLPKLVLQQYEKCGIKTMFEWQAECLKSEGVLNGGNLVYSAPTSAGKTLVAEILILKCVMELKKKALMILPFVSVTREKVYHLQKLFQSSGIRVDGFMGNHSPAGGFEMIDIGICTIEKANGLINRLIEENTISNLGILVVDELHMIGDPHRGYLLELLLTKLLYLHKRYLAKPNSVPSLLQPIQIVGMSATLPNIKLLADWLNARLHCTEFRPIPLSERLKIGNVVHCAQTMKVIQTFSPSLVDGDTDHVLHMCIESIASNHGTLIFCPTKAWCERLAESVARSVYEVGRLGSRNKHGLARYHDAVRSNLNVEDITEVLDHLRKSPAGLDPVLAKTVAFGVAFHHAGLTFDEREIIEGGFRRGVIKVLTATSTLSSGVNLPARRVIIRTPIFHGSIINVLTYRQMVGRAGRTGLDTEGESILICKENERSKAEALVKVSLPPVCSCLSISGQTIPSSLKRAMLEIIVSGAATSETEAIQYASCTLLEASLRQTESIVSSHETIRNCLQFLVDNEFVKDILNPTGSEGRVFAPTPLGKAVLTSSLSPDEGLIVYQELERARRCFVLENDLHVVYQVTPLNVSEQWANMDWLHYMRLWEQLSNDKKRVAECIGIEERYIIFAMKNEGTSSNTQRRTRLLRFYSALALLDLVNEMPLSVVAAKYDCNRGMLQSLQQSAATFAGMVTVFCHHLGWSTLELVLASFQNRLFFGVQQELCDLVRISLLNAHLARGLHNAGIKTVANLASANVEQVMSVISKSVPFESCKQRDIETEMEAQKRIRNRSVWIQGREPMSEVEAAKILIDEARILLRADIGGGPLKFNWNCESATRATANDGNKMSENSLRSEPTVITEVIEPNNESCDPVLENSELCPGQLDKFEEGSYSLDLFYCEKSQICVEENFNLQSSGSVLSLSLTNNEEPVAVSKEIPKSERMLYLSSDSDSDFNVYCKREPTVETKIEDLTSDTNESVSLFPELENNERMKEICSDSLIRKFLSDSADFTLSKSLIAQELNPESVIIENEGDLDSQELFASPLAKSSPFNVNLKSPRKLDGEEFVIKRQKVEAELSSDLYRGCNDSICHCEVKIRDVENLQAFVNEWSEQPYYTLAFACEKAPLFRRAGAVSEIGNGFMSHSSPLPSTSKYTEDDCVSLLGNQVYVVGLAISWEVHSVSYIDFKLFQREKLKLLLKQGFASDKTSLIVGYSLKEQIRLISVMFDCLPRTEVGYCDPKVASWLFDQDSVGNFAQNVERLIPGKLHFVREFLQSKQNVGLGMNLTMSRHTARMRASLEADLIHQMASECKGKLQEINLLTSFKEIEMKSLLPLVHLELNGIGVDVKELQRHADILKENLKKLEMTAHLLAGHEFNLASPVEVAKVLYSELNLELTNGDEETEVKPLKARQSLFKGTSESLRRQLKKRGRLYSLKTNKDTLKKLTGQHLLPSIILSWRRLQSALCKNVIPILKFKTFVPHMNMHRVMSNCDSLTATGRITLAEPDIQMVPRDFVVEIPDAEDSSLCLRKVFIPYSGGVFVGADFSQLELRILAEFSEDSKLKSALNSGDDVFKSIASQWKCCTKSEVTDADRHHAKQICYGMIYGMGAKSLGDQLEIDSEEALAFMEEFKSQYPGVRNFISSTVEKCRQLGYVETLSSRRRYLSDLQSSVINVRLHGERQAVNSTIQGSAADIFKKALIAVESSLECNFPQRYEIGPRLVLQLHDELIYESGEAEAMEVAHILKHCMETTTSLSVILPVRVKIGPSWGEMKYVDF